MTRPRDSQRKKLYRAENEAGCWDVMEWGKRAELATCQQFIDHVLKRPWLVRQFGKRAVTVTHSQGKSGACATRHTIYVSTYARNRWVLLHELAHCLTTSNKLAAHGREYAAVYVMLVTRVMGSEQGAALRAAFRKHGVRYRVVTDAQRAAGERLAAKSRTRGDGGAALAKYHAEQREQTVRLVAAGWVKYGKNWRKMGTANTYQVETRAAALAIVDSTPRWVGDASATSVLCMTNGRAEYLSADTTTPTPTTPSELPGAYWPE